MGKTRAAYPPEFRRQLVRDAQQSDLRAARLSCGLICGILRLRSDLLREPIFVHLGALESSCVRQVQQNHDG